jgi:hypothetical protein
LVANQKQKTRFRFYSESGFSIVYLFLLKVVKETYRHSRFRWITIMSPAINRYHMYVNVSHCFMFFGFPLVFNKYFFVYKSNANVLNIFKKSKSCWKKIMIHQIHPNKQ